MDAASEGDLFLGHHDLAQALASRLGEERKHKR